MAQVDVSTSSDLEPEAAWKLASDLSRFEELMDDFRRMAEQSAVDDRGGTQISSCVKVKGFRNVIHWTVTRYHEPKSIELQGRGRGGIRISVAMAVADNHPGSTFHLTADLKGGVLSRPIGKVVATVVRSDA